MAYVRSELSKIVTRSPSVHIQIIIHLSNSGILDVIVEEYNKFLEKSNAWVLEVIHRK